MDPIAEAFRQQVEAEVNRQVEKMDLNQLYDRMRQESDRRRIRRLFLGEHASGR